MNDELPFGAVPPADVMVAESFGQPVPVLMSPMWCRRRRSTSLSSRASVAEGRGVVGVAWPRRAEAVPSRSERSRRGVDGVGGCRSLAGRRGARRGGLTPAAVPPVVLGPSVSSGRTAGRTTRCPWAWAARTSPAPGQRQVGDRGAGKDSRPHGAFRARRGCRSRAAGAG